MAARTPADAARTTPALYNDSSSFPLPARHNSSAEQQLPTGYLNSSSQSQRLAADATATQQQQQQQPLSWVQQESIQGVQQPGHSTHSDWEHHTQHQRLQNSHAISQGTHARPSARLSGGPHQQQVTSSSHPAAAAAGGGGGGVCTQAPPQLVSQAIPQLHAAQPGQHCLSQFALLDRFLEKQHLAQVGDGNAVLCRDRDGDCRGI